LKNTKEESNNWFNKIHTVVINESRNEVFTNIILTEISVYYGEITKYVEKVKNLIVIVSRGRSGNKNLLFGITPSTVIRYVNCPVLIKN
jgi:nucleotide-binding universal stress UspA family protein